MELTLEQKRAVAIARAKKAAALAQPQATQISTTEDVAKGLGSGLVEGAYATAVAPKTLGELAGQGITYGIDRLRGLTPEEASAEQERVRKASEAYASGLPIPSPFALLQSGYEAIKPYVSYTPQTVAGQYAKTVGEFAPAALSPGSALQRVAAAAAPAIASETAGQLTKGTSAEPVARLVGGLVGARVAAPRTTAIKEAAKLAPSDEKLATQVSAAYKRIDDAGVVYNPRTFRQKIADLRSDLIDKDLDEGAKNVFTTVDRMWRAPASRMTPGFIDQKHSQLGKIMADPNASGQAKEAARLSREALMEIIGTQPLRSASGATGADVASMTRQARELAAAKIKSGNIATRQAVGEWYQSGGISGVRNQLSNLAKSLEKSKGMGWTDLEKDALRLAAKGNVTTNFLNMLGKFGFNLSQLTGQGALLPVIGAISGGVQGGLLGGLVVPAAGTAARYGAQKMTQKNVDLLKKVVMAGKSGQAAGISAADRKNADALIRQLIASGQAGALSAEE